jgi:hypothetical protein
MAHAAANREEMARTKSLWLLGVGEERRAVGHDGDLTPWRPGALQTGRHVTSHVHTTPAQPWRSSGRIIKEPNSGVLAQVSYSPPLVLTGHCRPVDLLYCT